MKVNCQRSSRSRCLQRPVSVTPSVLTSKARLPSIMIGRVGKGWTGPVNSKKQVTHWPGVPGTGISPCLSHAERPFGNICKRVTVFPSDPFFVLRAPEEQLAAPAQVLEFFVRFKRRLGGGRWERNLII